MSYNVTQSIIDSDTVSISKVNFTYNPLSSEVNYLTGSLRFYNHPRELSLLEKAIDTNDWDEYNNLYSTSNILNSIPNIKNYAGYVYTANKMPALFTVTYDPSLKVASTDAHKLIHSSSLPALPEHLLPIAVRYIDSAGNYYIERPPFQIEVDMRSTHSRMENGKRIPPYKIWVPWTISIYRPGNPELYVYFSSSSLSSYDQIYLNCLFPNTYGDSRICFSNSLESLHNYSAHHEDIRTNYSYMFNEYMNGGWNLDLSPNIYKCFEILLSNRISHTKAEIEILNTVDQDYPLVKFFLNPPKEYIKKRFPKITSRQLQYFEYTRNWFSTPKTYKYMFMIMSTFDVDQTLEFYRQISELSYKLRCARYPEKEFNFNDVTKNFRDLVNLKASSQDQQFSSSTVSGLYHSFSSVFSSKVSIDSVQTLYIDLGYETNIVFVNYEDYTQYVDTKSKVSSYIKHIPEESMNSIITYLSSNKLDINHFILYDFKTHTFTVEEVEVATNRSDQKINNSLFISDLAKSYAGRIKVEVS